MRVQFLPRGFILVAGVALDDKNQRICKHSTQNLPTARR